MKPGEVVARTVAEHKGGSAVVVDRRFAWSAGELREVSSERATVKVPETCVTPKVTTPPLRACWAKGAEPSSPTLPPPDAITRRLPDAVGGREGGADQVFEGEHDKRRFVLFAGREGDEVGCGAYWIGKASARAWGTFWPGEAKTKAYVMKGDHCSHEGCWVMLALRRKSGELLAARRLMGGDNGMSLEALDAFGAGQASLVYTAKSSIGGWDSGISSDLFHVVDGRLTPILRSTGVETVGPEDDGRTCRTTIGGYFVVRKKGASPEIVVPGGLEEDEPSTRHAWSADKKRFELAGDSDYRVKVRRRCW